MRYSNIIVMISQSHRRKQKKCTVEDEMECNLEPFFRYFTNDVLN